MAAIHAGSRVSSAQAVTATAVSTDSVDLSVARDIAEGETIFANIVPVVTPTAAGAATVTFEVITATDAALTAGVVVHAATRAVAIADLAVPAGVGAAPALRIAIPVPPRIGSTGARYLGVRYTIATGPLTGGAFNASFGPSIHGDERKFYPSGFVVA